MCHMLTRRSIRIESRLFLRIPECESDLLFDCCIECGSSPHKFDLAIDLMESLYTMLSKHSAGGFAKFPIITHSVYSIFFLHI